MRAAYNAQPTADHRAEIALLESRSVALNFVSPRVENIDIVGDFNCNVYDRIRRLIKAGILPAQQVVPGAPHQIRASDLKTDRVVQAIGRKGRPCRLDPENQIPMFTDT